MSQAPDATVTIKLTDVAEAAGEAIAAATDPALKVTPLPPPTLMQIIGEATAVWTAKQAAGKDWWRSKGLWGAIGAMASAVAALVIPVAVPLADRPLAATIAGVGGIFFAALAGHGRAVASGPLK